MRRTSPPPLHKCTPLWECAVSSTCITQHITPAHIHKHTQPQMCSHARTQSLPQQNRFFLFVFFLPLSPSTVNPQILPPADVAPLLSPKPLPPPLGSLLCKSSVLPKLLCVCGCGFGPGCWLWHTNLSHELYSDWRGFWCECVCVFVYWGHH